MRQYSSTSPSARGVQVLSSDPDLIRESLLRFVQLRTAMCFGRKDAPADYRAPAQAISYPYISTGTNQHVRLLAIDIDHSETGIHCWSDAGLPPPHFIVQNPAKPGSIHLIYALTYPVSRYGNTPVTSPVTSSVTRPVASTANTLFRKVKDAITRQVGGDRSYAGSRVKSPACEDWISYTCLQAPAEGYTLVELAAELDMSAAVGASTSVGRQHIEGADAQSSRNKALLHHLMVYARTACHRSGSEGNLAHNMQAEADSFNEGFSSPLTKKEVKNVIRWVSREAWDYHLTTARPAFVAKQKARGRKSGATRSAAAQEKAARIAELRSAGMSWADVAAEMQMTLRACQSIHQRNRGGIPTTWFVSSAVDRVKDAMCCNVEVDVEVDEVDDRHTNREEQKVAKTGATRVLLGMQVGDWTVIGSAPKERQSYLQLASRLKRMGKGKWKMMKQPCGSTFAIRREA